jgi:hypothetical protein
MLLESMQGGLHPKKILTEREPSGMNVFRVLEENQK